MSARFEDKLRKDRMSGMTDQLQAGGSRRDRQIQRKRQEIILAATQLFSDKGFGNTSTKDIAEAADIGESTLYNYFANKRDILLAILSETGFAFDAMLENVKGLENRDGLVALFEMGINIFVSRMAFTRTLLAQAWVDDEILEGFVMRRLGHVSMLLQRFITKMVATGTFRPMDPALASRLTIGMFLGVVLPSLRGIEPSPTPDERHRIAEAVVNLLWNGIRNQ
jgi:AcrR family transcriptional regulator